MRNWLHRDKINLSQWENSKGSIWLLAIGFLRLDSFDNNISTLLEYRALKGFFVSIDWKRLLSVEFAARLERSSFFEEGRRAKTREWKAEIGVQNNIQKKAIQIIEPLLYYRKNSNYSASKSESASAETFSPSSLDFSFSAFL